MPVKPSFFGALKRREQYETDATSGCYFDYTHYREAIAEDCKKRCVYCDSHEDTIGGREAMQIDHFRPWNKGFGVKKEKKFEHLKHVPENLLHSCGVCNRFKSARWPTDNPNLPHDDDKGWVDPFAEHRSDYLAVGLDGAISPRKPVGQYLISVLRLNRPLLKRQRELRQLLDFCDSQFASKWRADIQNSPDSSQAKNAHLLLSFLAIARSSYDPD